MTSVLTSDIPTKRQVLAGPIEHRAKRSYRLPLLASAGAFSAAASMIAVRLATPLAIDEKLTAIVLFFVAPAVIVLVVGALHQRTALILAGLQPILWTAAARSEGDSLALWAIPLVSTGVLVALARTERTGRGRRTLHLAAVVALGAAILFPAAGAPEDGTRVVLIGIDGASWQCIDEAVDGGRMPNIERLLETGHRAKLRSLPSMFSPQVWSAIATGCQPSVNGIDGWASCRADLHVGRVWDRMRADGRSVGTCCWYFTWPPPDGLTPRDFSVPSTLAPDSRTFPQECSFFWELWASESGRREYKVSYPSVAVRALRGGVRLSTFRRALSTLLGRRSGDPEALDQAWRGRRLSAAIESDMFCELLRDRRPELGVILLNQLDKASHAYWKYREPQLFPDVDPAEAHRLGGVIEELYAEADRSVGKILGVIPADAHVVVVSDHGFRPALRKVMGRFCRIRTEALVKALSVEESVLGSNLDLKVYLQATSGTEAERSELLRRLEGILRAAHLKGEDVPLFDVAQDGALLRVEIAPRDAVPENARIVINGQELPFDALVIAAQEARFSGEHAPDGVYLLAGPKAAWAARTDSLSVLDVAPTLAALLDLPMSPDWTGRPAFEFDQGFPYELRFGEYRPPSSPLTGPSVPADDALKEKLRALGYLE